MTGVGARGPVGHAFRIASLVLPSALAWHVAFSATHRGELTDAVTFALGPLWMLLAGALALRIVLLWGRRRGTGLAELDVLTGKGTALAWLSAAAIVCAVWFGWASLAAVGLLGTGVFHVVVLLTFVAVRGADPMRSASVSRRFVPEVVTEGDAVLEELRIAGARIPIGFRLFAAGRVGPRWATSRHILDAAESGAEVVVESNVGPALRGTHDPEPIALWLQDNFGLCRSVQVHVGTARLTVLPRLRAVEKAAPLLDRGDGPRAPRPTSRLPTEGAFRLREYQQGDDVRRIHWVRSLAARELVVRLPDELPPDRPRVRLVLDTFFPEAHALACNAPDELLDSLVSVWLALGRTLAESGARVTLVTALPLEGRVAVSRHELSTRAMGKALAIGAQVCWQSGMALDALLTNESTLVVTRAAAGNAPYFWKGTPSGDNVRWIVMPPEWFSSPDAWPSPAMGRLPHPMGSSENRGSHRRAERRRRERACTDHRLFMTMRGDAGPPAPGTFLAVPNADGAIRLEVLR